MSRTIRRKNGWGWAYGHGMRHVSESLKVHHYRPMRYDEIINPKSKEGRKIIAKFHSDASYHENRNSKGWRRNLFLERPHRRDAKNQIRKAMLDDFECVIEEMPKRKRWWV